MTSDQRLDQLEPLVSQTLAVADRHTAQLKQIYGVLSQHSDTLQFILREMVEVKQGIGELKQDVGDLKQGMGALQESTNVRLDVVDANVSGLGTNLGGLDTKLDRILGLLDASK
ncbi:hypothetical protein [Hymenobacter sp. UYCo722]|uniref:hypothetical protein n=1 Tax=Hymenobacter sp. UYCo722 TaxID=3156335 RepID=UPI0033942EC5